MATVVGDVIPKVYKPALAAEDVSSGAKPAASDSVYQQVLKNSFNNYNAIKSDKVNDYYKKHNEDLKNHYNWGTAPVGNNGTGYKETGIPGVTMRGSGSVVSTAPSKGDVSSPTVSETPEVAQPTVEDRYKTAMEATNDRLRQAYEYQQSVLQKQKDDAVREAYIKQQMQLRAYPEQLAAKGLTGGATESTIARNNADYANARAQAYSDMASGISSAGQAYQQGVLSSNENYLQQMAAYYEALEQMEKQYEHEAALARLKASLG